MRTRVAKRARAAAVLLLAAALVTACVPKLAVRPMRYDVTLELVPEAGTLEGRASVELEPLDADRPPKRRAAVELQLHPDLALQSVETGDATLVARKRRGGRHGEKGKIVPATHRLTLEHPSREIRLTLAYRGRLHQDIGAGEKEGEIHNFAVSAHVGEEGVYLAGDGYWYPRVAFPENVDPERTLADYHLSVRPVEGFELVAGLERDETGEDGSHSWSSPFPLDAMVLLGGPLRRFSRAHGGIELHAVLAPGKQKVAEDILDAAAEYLDRYQTLVGPYPFREFTVLEAFFSSGFAFPTCTQIVGSQLSEYEQYRRHGYLDHELLHNWWGNGVLVDPRDGNWCEALTSYLANYYGHVLDGDESGARKERRNQSNFLSAIEPKNDKPLATFGLKDGAGGGIGYQKGAAVFHMLERKIGREALFAALRRLTSERMGRFASWADLQQVFERESGQELEAFFEQWVRRGGAPALELTGAEIVPGEGWAVTISQGSTDFTLDVPLRLQRGGRTEEVVVTVDRPVDRVVLAGDTSDLTSIELDPDYHLFRKLKPEEIMPTSALTRRTEGLLVVVPEGELAEGYRVTIDSFTRAVLGDAEDPKPGHEVEVLQLSRIDDDDLARGSVLIVGAAVHHPTVRRFVERTRCPVTWSETGFAVEGLTYDDPRQAVYLTVHHPDRPGEGVTLYYGNSAESLANARVLSYYANSLLVFDTPSGSPGESAAPTAMPRTEVIRRIDFEFPDRIDF